MEFATNQFEENTKKIEELIRQREENIALAGELKDLIDIVDNKDKDWKKTVQEAEDKFSDDIIDTLNIIGRTKSKKSQNYLESMKILKAKVNNLESNLHIEIDMERLEDSSKALSFIGIEIADALKLIPTPKEIARKVEEEQQEEILANQEAYREETTFEAKPSLWQRFKKSKFVRAATYVFRIRVRIELPSNALPEGRGDE